MNNKVFNSEDELFWWFKEDLENQRQKYKNTHNNKEAPDSELTLRTMPWKIFSTQHSPEYREMINLTTINFDFNFRNILSKLGINKNDGKGYLICPFHVNFNGTTFSKKANFSNATFSQEAYFKGATFSQEATFSFTTFSQDANFSFTTFGKEATFSFTTFSQDANFSFTTFSQDANFSFTTFSQKADFYNAVFSQKAYFERTEFQEKVDFKDATLTNCDFTMVKFKGEADFKRAKFYNENTFEYTQFNDRGAFHGAYFEQNPKFYNLILSKESHVYFGNLNRINRERDEENETELEFKDKIKIEGKKIKIKKFTIENTIINGRLDFNNDNISVLDMKGSIVVGTLSRVLYDPKCANWDTACILKNEELKRNNTIKALEYQAKEKELYKKELGDKKNKTWSEWKDIFALGLGEIVNNHGQDWGRAILFTLGAWIIPFMIFRFPNPFYVQEIKNILPVYWETISSTDFWADLVKYFSPTEYEILVDYINETPVNGLIKAFGMIVYFLGKIAVPYGVYEVIKAFRKYK